jgi:hypothetical protein
MVFILHTRFLTEFSTCKHPTTGINSMQPIPTQCPLCGGEITVTRLHCRDCDSTIEGRFSGGPFNQLSPEQLKFVEYSCDWKGRLNTWKEIGLSYPTATPARSFEP